MNTGTANTVLSASEIAVYARGAGFTGQSLATAIAVALAESAGNTEAYNPETAAGTPEGMGSYGLWQVYLKVHPEYDPDSLTDPAYNAAAAFSISRSGTNWSPWSTYKNKAYLAHIPAAELAVVA